MTTAKMTTFAPVYSVVDIETTGGKTTSNRITEIAIVITDGFKIIEKYSTLINPHRKIDKFVIQLTGITDAMVANAPSFEEVIDKVDEMTKDTIFVAHNVGFDYSIIKREYRRLDKSFKRNNLCTVQLSRKTLKDQNSYSLGKLAANIGIEVKQRHRAMGDAEATALLLHHIIGKEGEEFILNQTAHNTHQIEFKGEITHDVIEELPEDSGTFSFLDKEGNVLYIGFAKNIFATTTKFLINEAKLNPHHGLMENMFAIDYQVINSFLVTQLSAYADIMRLKPVFNKSKNQRELSVGVYEKTNDLVKSVFEVDNRKDGDALWRFSNFSSAKRFVKKALKSKKLTAPVFSGDDDAFDNEYHAKIDSFLKDELYPKRNFFIIRDVSYENKAYVIWVENYVYKGFGQIDLDYFDQNIDTLKECIRPQKNTQTIQKLVKKYMLKAKGIKIVEY